MIKQSKTKPIVKRIETTPLLVEELRGRRIQLPETQSSIHKIHRSGDLIPNLVFSALPKKRIKHIKPLPIVRTIQMKPNEQIKEAIIRGRRTHAFLKAHSITRKPRLQFQSGLGALGIEPSCQQLGTLKQCNYQNEIEKIVQERLNQFRTRVCPNEVVSLEPVSLENLRLPNFSFEEVESNSESPEEEKRIDLAFLFASPLVTVYQNKETLKFKPMASLDYIKEFELLCKSFTDSNKAIKFTKSVATISNFQRCLNDMPLALHFSGHGITNKAFSLDKAKEGDYLVFEDERGKAHYISCLELRKILASCSRQPEFVFVSSCHSRLVGEVFRNAGAKHVICVKRSEEILDKVAYMFSHAFYTAFFSCFSVCQAFQNAKAILEANIKSHNLEETESDKFELLLGDTPMMIHNCICTIHPPEGKPEFLTSTSEYNSIPSEVEHFVGRKIELYSLICLLADNRLVTIRGVPGIGKTSLVKSMAHFIQDRQYFANGIIYVSTRGLESMDAVVNEIYIACKPEREICTATMHEKLMLIVKMLVHKSVLLILDNVEDACGKDRERLLDAIHFLLSQLTQLKIILTSRVALGPIPDYSEKIINLYPLDPESAILLLEKRAPRKISEVEFIELIEDSFSHCSNSLYGGEGLALKHHKLMELLSGHPQAISLAAALLHTRTLSELYSEMSLNSLQPNEMISLKSSLELSIQTLKLNDCNSIYFFKMMGLFPTGATTGEMKAIWGLDYTSHIQNLLSTSLLVRKEQSDCYWILPFMADFAFEWLREFDISHIHSNCCDYYSKQLALYCGNYRECGNLKRIPQEANILACIKRAKQLFSRPEVDPIDEREEFLEQSQSDIQEKEDNAIPPITDAHLAIPNNEVIELLPRERSKLTSVINRLFPLASQVIETSGIKNFISPYKSIIVNIESKLSARAPSKFQKVLKSRTSSMSRRPNTRDRYRLEVSLGYLIIHFATCLIKRNRYRDAKKIIGELMSFKDEINSISLQAHALKLLGVIAAETKEGEAEHYYLLSKSAFIKVSSLIGQASCSLALALLKLQENDKKECEALLKEAQGKYRRAKNDKAESQIKLYMENHDSPQVKILFNIILEIDLPPIKFIRNLRFFEVERQNRNSDSILSPSNSFGKSMGRQLSQQPI